MRSRSGMTQPKSSGVLWMDNAEAQVGFEGVEIGVGVEQVMPSGQRWFSSIYLPARNVYSVAELCVCSKPVVCL
jgi:hypothetical protein